MDNGQPGDGHAHCTHALNPRAAAPLLREERRLLINLEASVDLGGRRGGSSVLVIQLG